MINALTDLNVSRSVNVHFESIIPYSFAGIFSHWLFHLHIPIHLHSTEVKIGAVDHHLTCQELYFLRKLTWNFRITGTNKLKIFSLQLFWLLIASLPWERMVSNIWFFKTVIKLISECHQRPKCDFDKVCQIAFYASSLPKKN